MSRQTLMEVIYLIIMFSFFGIPFAIAGMWFWFFFVLSIVFCFGAFEIARKVMTGKTLSTKYYEMRKTNPVKYWVINVTMVIFWSMLLAHLAFDVPGRWF